ncbi:AAA family ATPase [Leisingera aquaemixtae]|uniref:AAA family ATPase n=1 Tax=Leisingera aquaemixtae TaxID=1396826 RepID=UPI0021A88561|nr:AAA family ATPase [Leisingera aquaemixtae]UWQ46868.1 AAA family ATPase [Leisingera aquaemixtae]
MIRIKMIKIEEFRGIRELSLDLEGDNFGICGPNGTGKSGVVDAIEFCLTGNITRLSGQGAGELNVRGHAPHVDQRDNPDKATVTIAASIPALGKDVTIKRSVKSPRTVSITPNDSAIEAVVEELRMHPEFALSRREIAKYIVTPPARRSDDVQNLLRLDHIGRLRSSFVTYANTCKRDANEAERSRKRAEDDLKRALELPSLDRKELLKRANEQRRVLGQAEIAELKPDTNFKDGLDEGEDDNVKKPAISKKVALADLKSLADAISTGEPETQRQPRQDALEALEKLKEDEKALLHARQHGLISTGLELVDADACPLCDKPWDAEELRAHLEEKLLSAEAMGTLLKAISGDLEVVSGEIAGRIAAMKKAADYADKLEPKIARAALDAEAQALQELIDGLQAFAEDPAKIDEALSVVTAEWWTPEAYAQTCLEEVHKAVSALPDRSANDKAVSFLTELQVRYDQLLAVTKQAKAMASRNKIAQKVHSHYDTVSNSVLEGIYDAVAKEFTDFYKAINDDEGKFVGELKAEPAKLSFNVDFYGRGTFPPGAYHSEGHQDGMGLCLYLALMKHTLGDKFTFAVLDDVLMSVDTGHRREVCRLLKTKFPNTQFILTTHDKVWLQYMRTEGLIKKGQFFGGWNVDTGPRIWDDTDIWTEIDGALAKNDVPRAAALLRRYLEYIATVLADNLRAKVEYRSDANYDLGDLWPPVTNRWRDRLKQGVKTAAHWGHDSVKDELEKRLAKAVELIKKTNAEQWAINKSVHFNEWENFTVSEFKEVADAFKALLEHIRCPNPKCGGYPYLEPRKGSSEQLRCSCLTVNINLKMAK